MLNFRTLVAASALVLLAACGGGGGKAGTSPFNGNSTSSGGSATNSAALTLGVALVDGSGATTTALVGSSTLRVQAILKKGGVAQANELVQFSIEQSSNSAVLDQLTALTDSTGTAVVNLSAGTTAGAGQVKANAQLLDGTSVEGATNFVASPTAQSTRTLTLANFQTNSTQVSAYGTTGFQVSVLENGTTPTQPVTVTFSSDCAVGKATVTSSAQTNSSGVAVGTFEDVGCATSATRNVLLTASISTNSAQKQIQVLPSTVGSLRFVSVSPSDASITLKGNGGGAGRQENAQLTFKLVDQAGNGVDNVEVCFDSTTYIGGLTLDGFNDQPGKTPTTQGSAALCGTDVISKIKYIKRTDQFGNIAIQIASGNIPTPVRVRARAIYPSTATTALETFSDSLSISTGAPLQRSMSLSVDKANIDAGNGTAGGGIDGDEATLTVRLADQFSNPVPDGTKVTFVASGGAVCTSQNGSCSTSNGVCSCKLVGQNSRPKDGRVVVLAYAAGLEDYVDVNGDNSYTVGVDTFADLPDAFVDANKSGSYSGASVNGDTDIPVSFQSPANYLSGDGVRSNVHIRSSAVIYFSAPSGTGDPTVVIPNRSLNVSTDLLTNTNSSKYIRLDVSGCSVFAPQTSFEAYLDDGYGNPMAAGTTLTASDFPENLAAKSVKPSTVLAFGAAAPNPLVDGPLNGNGGNVIKVIPWAPGASKGNVTTPHVVTIQGVKDKCAGNPSFVLDAASPKGAGKSVRILYEGEPRNVSPARGAFDVRYLDPIQFSLNTSSTAVTTGVISIATASFAHLVPNGFASYELDWGDGVVQTGTSLPLSIQSHSYATTGSKTVRFKIIDTAGVTFTAAPQSVNVTP